MESFYEKQRGRISPQVHTRGPWHDDAQHGGPISALLASGLEPLLADDEELVRFQVRFRRQTPLEPLELQAARLGGGRRVGSFTSQLRLGERVVAEAAGLSIRRHPTKLKPSEDRLERPPEDCPPLALPFFLSDEGYHRAVEFRALDGEFGSGQMTVWMRPRLPLFPDASLSPTSRVLLVADSASGVSAILDTSLYTFLNSDLDVCLIRPAHGEWIGLRARTHLSPTGSGISDTELFDEHGRIGRATQCLVVASR